MREFRADSGRTLYCFRAYRTADDGLRFSPIGGATEPRLGLIGRSAGGIARSQVKPSSPPQPQQQPRASWAQEYNVSSQSRILAACLAE